MNKHFIRDIKRDKYEYLGNFEAKGIKRVNLITGYNSIGKSVLLELLKSKVIKKKGDIPNFINHHSDIARRKVNSHYEKIKDKGDYEYFLKIMQKFDKKIESFSLKSNSFECTRDGGKILLFNMSRGTIRFILILLTLLNSKDSFLFIDDIEEAIHNQKLYLLWEVILPISKQNNIQVFASTHSIECTKALIRTAEYLGQEDITVIELGKNNKNETKALVYGYDFLLEEINQNHTIEGWD